jgi:hypothetical protein
MSSSRLLLFLIIATGVLACEKIAIEDYKNDSPQAIFKEAWTFADHYYSFFELKGVDWDSVYTEYEDRISQDMNGVELFDVLAEMFYLLEDGHVNLRSGFDRSRYWEWYLGAPENFDYSVIERHYFQNRQRFIGPFQAVAFDSIAYVYLGSFGSSFSDSQLDLLIRSFQDAKGMIIDVRNNGGGSSSLAKKLAARFTTESVLVGRKRYKNGPGPIEFSEWEEMRLDPYDSDPDSEVNYTKPVAVLVNRKSYSATNSFVQHMDALDNVTLIGDQSGGGAGTPKFTELANGWILRLSATQKVMPDGYQVEQGIPPDIEIDITEQDMEENEDTILEFALEFLQ